MWVTTSKCYAANTADLWSIDLQGLEQSDPIIESRKELWSGYSVAVNLLKEHLLALDIFLVKASLRDYSLVQFVTGAISLGKSQNIPSSTGYQPFTLVLADGVITRISYSLTSHFILCLNCYIHKLLTII